MKPENISVVAVIPARGGSKGIPRKNIVDLCGKPLIAYSIEVALKAKTIDRVVVSTDDQEIASVSRAWGAEVPFIRPESLSGDCSDMEAVFNHALSVLAEEGYNPDILVQLFPTHPFRTPRLVDFLVNKTAQGYGTVRTVRARTVSPDSHYIIEENKTKRLLPMVSDQQTHYNEIQFRAYGVFISTNLRNPNLHGFYLHVLTDPVTFVDIDEPEDLELAREIINSNYFDFGLP
ncbi:acylneuraminate cytidylyltransferase family protein [Desulfosarcina alkanivorans]|uniref:acylneuraminate cytidylyltransferase family protein n=1 Tax=Desulfosarcina alkanivorans TaxID=571177 RepID=UPI001E5C2060|nr:acylneuraminate cytidylyltransferase family protein [Desulfosarcina alkanivorans]